VFEQPSSCIDMAAKTTEDPGPNNYFLVLHLTSHGLNIYYRYMSGSAAYGPSAMSLGHLSAYRLCESLAKRVIQACGMEAGLVTSERCECSLQSELET